MGSIMLLLKPTIKFKFNICRDADKSLLLLFPIFLFATQTKEFVLDGLKKLEQQIHNCVELRGNRVSTFFSVP
jgi:hypothetical protein